jgi:hypothetical protein
MIKTTLKNVMSMDGLILRWFIYIDRVTTSEYDITDGNYI